MPSDTVYITIPCYNEEHRLRVDEFTRLARSPGVHVVLVNDGSSDGTLKVMESVKAAAPAAVTIVDLKQNGGKAEAVRQGFLKALGLGASTVGFLDADLSTPVDEALRLVEILKSKPTVKVVLASRVALLGYTIKRHLWRHYLGRVFATVASNALNLVVYDTQCGAKFFRSTPTLMAALAERFFSPWIFDVELISRLMKPAGAVARYTEADFLEVPLYFWEDVKGSKMNPWSMLKSGLALILLGIRIRLTGHK